MSFTVKVFTNHIDRLAKLLLELPLLSIDHTLSSPTGFQTPPGLQRASFPRQSSSSLLLCFFITFYFSSTFNDEQSLTTNVPQRRTHGKSLLLIILFAMINILSFASFFSFSPQIGYDDDDDNNDDDDANDDSTTASCRP
jgi:hypothetical protein